MCGLEPGYHLCVVYDRSLKRVDLSSLLAGGAELCGQKLIYAVGGVSDEPVSLVPSLILRPPNLMSLSESGGRLFDAGHFLAMLEDESERVLRGTFGTCRFLLNMSEVARCAENFEKLADFERHYDEFLRRRGHIGFCLFDKDIISVEVLLQVLELHHHALIGGHLLDSRSLSGLDEYGVDGLPPLVCGRDLHGSLN